MANARISICMKNEVVNINGMRINLENVFYYNISHNSYGYYIQVWPAGSGSCLYVTFNKQEDRDSAVRELDIIMSCRNLA
jgi:hypothetical protein